MAFTKSFRVLKKSARKCSVLIFTITTLLENSLWFMFPKTFVIIEQFRQVDNVLIVEINLLLLELSCLVLFTFKNPTADVFLGEPSDLCNITTFESCFWAFCFYVSKIKPISIKRLSHRSKEIFLTMNSKKNLFSKFIIIFLFVFSSPYMHPNRLKFVFNVIELPKFNEKERFVYL